MESKFISNDHFYDFIFNWDYKFYFWLEDMEVQRVIM